jgi:hypothetical protein
MCLTLNRRPPVIDHHNADEPAMKNARHGFSDAVLVPPDLALGVSEARHNR